MKNTSVYANRLIMIGIIILSAIVCFPSVQVLAENKQIVQTAEIYESSEGFSLSGNDKVASTSYGSQIGSFFINGSIRHESTYNGNRAFAAENMLTFGYKCTSEHYEDASTPGKWSYFSSPDKEVGDIKLSKDIAEGTILIQKSTDGKTWINACDPIRNIFSNKKHDLAKLYTTSDADVNSGMFFRVLVLYNMGREVNPHKGLFGRTAYDTEILCVVEKYSFYISYAYNPIKLLDINSRQVASNNSTVIEGFTIDDNGANAIITVKKDNGTEKKAKSHDSFSEPGTYVINATSPLGDNFQTKVTVSGGLSTTAVPSKKYINKEKTGYKINSNDGHTDGVQGITYLMIGQNAGTTIKTAVVNGFKGFGITGNSVSLYLKLTNLENYSKSGWEVVSDDWGKKEKQKIEGVWTGTVASGALIIQKSKDGKNWTQVDDGRYAQGLYTTDFYKKYSESGNVLIYSPKGEDVIQGLYLRVLYAYEIKKSDGKEKNRIVEEYSFYLCNDELGAVTFHNLSAKEQLESILGEEDEITVKMYETAETMNSGVVTSKGFSIDTSLNPTVKYSVTKDGNAVKGSKFTDTGRYDITLTSAVGSTRNVTLYVDCMSDDQTLKMYFGEGFIDGKRIYDENSKYPVFEGGETKYNFEKVSENYLPLYGTITNVTTGKSAEISASRSGITKVLNDPGEYVVVMNNNPSFKTETPSGDNKEITFHFNIIAHGTAPGPQVNKKSLEKTMNESVSGTYPKYYGLTYSSATKGNITLAFSTREAARQYAYNYEKGTVEKQADGTYRYTGSFTVKQKDKYDSAWDLTDAINYFADQAIQELYFDVSDEATYRTLKDATLEKNKNPRTLELSSSVVIFAEGQEELLTNLDSLPILNLLPYAYQEPGKDKKSEIGKAAFSFVKDKYGCDSNKVTISDSTGKEITIAYNKDVESQLKAAGFKSGKVKITEETIYGDTNSYDAVYFADHDNTAKVTVLCEGDKNKSVVVSQDDENTTIEAEAFSIKSISDELDPYCLVLVTDASGKTVSFCADKPTNGMWSDEGVYDISVVNRIGNKYSFKINIAEAKYATITYQGEGTENFKPLLVKNGEKNVSLEVPTRYGYEFAGYDDEEGTIFEDVIEQVSFSGSKVLSPRWRAKKINIVLQGLDGNIIDTIEATFGSEIELPIPELPEGYSFLGWMNGDKPLEGNSIKIAEEGDKILIASTVQDNITSEPLKYNDDESNEKSNNDRFPIVPVAAAIIVGTGAIVLWRIKEKSFKLKNKKVDSKEDKNGVDVSASKNDGEDVNE